MSNLKKQHRASKIQIEVKDIIEQTAINKAALQLQADSDGGDLNTDSDGGDLSN